MRLEIYNINSKKFSRDNKKNCNIDNTDKEKTKGIHCYCIIDLS